MDMENRIECECIYEVSGHFEGQGECPYGPDATYMHPDGVLRSSGSTRPHPNTVAEVPGESGDES